MADDRATRGRRSGLATVALAAALFGQGLGAKEPEIGFQIPRHELTEAQAIVHALNRLGYGPRSGDVERVRAIGLATWIEQQLDPAVIPDARVERLLEPYTTLRLDTIELLAEYTPPNVLQQMARRLERPLGREAVEELLPEVAEGRDPAPGRHKRPDNGGLWRVQTEMAQAKLVRALHSERQLLEVMTDFWFNHFNVYAGKGADRWLVASYERDAIRPHALGRFRDLLGATARHPAMLFYLDNWMSSSADPDFGLLDMERYAVEAIREKKLPPGGLATLILRERGMDTRAVERQFLTQETRLVQASRSKRFDLSGMLPGLDDELPGRAGLNENYARELLELHTLGVDGGYTQDDIVAVARCFTGWTILPARAGQGFVYVDELHDEGTKTVLGQPVKGKGRAAGEAVLDVLARHPATARFIAHKLAVRFVRDDPPAALVERVAASFTKTDGDIPATLATLFASPEFWSPGAVGAKIKTPFEFVVSAGRATGMEVGLLPGTTGTAGPGRITMGGAPDRQGAAGMAGMDPDSYAGSEQPPALLAVLRDLGQPLYGAEPPTGYKDTADCWVSTGALLQRMKVALGLAVNRIGGTRTFIDVQPREEETSAEFVARLGEAVLGRPASAATLDVILTGLGLPPEQPAALGVPRRPLGRSRDGQAQIAAGWFLASAEFQRR